jgi:hypothetical protein
MFNVTVAMKEVGQHEKFNDAFKDYFVQVKKMVHDTGSRMALETMCWIECIFPGAIGGVPLHHKEFVDIGHAFGLLTEKGELADPMPEIPDKQLKMVVEGLAMGRAIQDFFTIVEDRMIINSDLV